MMNMTSDKTGTSHCLSSLMGQIAYRDEVVSCGMRGRRLILGGPIAVAPARSHAIMR